MRDRQLVDIIEHRQIAAESLSMIGAEFAQLPGRLPRKIRRLVEAEICSMLARRAGDSMI